VEIRSVEKHFAPGDEASMLSCAPLYSLQQRAMGDGRLLL